jgi:DNA-binding response OmpR family regulator
MSGHDITRCLRDGDVTRDVPILMITTSIDPADRETDLHAGCDQVLVLPVLPDRLLAEIRRLARSDSVHPEDSLDVVRFSEAERRAILRALDCTGWRISGAGGAAELLGLKPTTLHAKMRKLGIQRPTHGRTVSDPSGFGAGHARLWSSSDAWESGGRR